VIWGGGYAHSAENFGFFYHKVTHFMDSQVQRAAYSFSTQSWILEMQHGNNNSMQHRLLHSTLATAARHTNFLEILTISHVRQLKH
jgi:hypothetical protein